MIAKIFKWIFLVLFSLLIILPLIWLLFSSLKTNNEFFENMLGIPVHITLYNYRIVLTEQPMLRYLFNSFFVSISSTLIGLAVAMLASFIFLFDFKYKKFLRLFLTFGIFIPTSAFMIPYFLIISRIGLYDNLLGIALIYIAISLPSSFLIINNYMQDIVKTDILEASFLDGASFFECFTKIVTPISSRGAMTAAIILFINSWNELLYALLLSQSDRSRTVQVAISFLVATFSANFPQAFAAMIMAMLPIIVLYIFLNKRIVAGLGMAMASK